MQTFHAASLGPKVVFFLSFCVLVFAFARYNLHLRFYWPLVFVSRRGREGDFFSLYVCSCLSFYTLELEMLRVWRHRIACEGFLAACLVGSVRSPVFWFSSFVSSLTTRCRVVCGARRDGGSIWVLFLEEEAVKTQHMKTKKGSRRVHIRWHARIYGRCQTIR